MAKVISICNQKGGVGKTTSVIELAQVYSADYQILVVDLEMQRDTTKYAGGDYTLPGIYEVLTEEVSIQQAIQHLHRYDLICGSSMLSVIDATFQNEYDVLKLRSVLQQIEQEYDYIIIDTHPAKNLLLNMVYVASDYIVIPTLADQGSIDGIQTIFEELAEYQEKGYSAAEIIGIIYASVERTNIHQYQKQVIRELLDQYELFDVPICEIRKCVAAYDCKVEGVSMQEGARFSNSAMDYRKAANEILKQILARR